MRKSRNNEQESDPTPCQKKVRFPSRAKQVTESALRVRSVLDNKTWGSAEGVSIGGPRSNTPFSMLTEPLTWNVGCLS